MRSHHRFLALASLALAAACGDDTTMQPTTLTYQPFDQAAYTAARSPLAFYEKTDALIQTTGFSAASFGIVDVDINATPVEKRCVPASAPAAGTVAELFLQDSTCQKVVTRVEPHAYATGAGTDLLGQELHKSVVLGVKGGAAAMTPMDLDVAGERIKKTMLRYFYESIVAGTTAGTKQGWDEAFAAWGHSLDGKTASGMALFAQKRDVPLKTSFEQDIWSAFLRGRKALAEGKSADLPAIAADIDGKLILLIAYYAGGEFLAWPVEVDDRPAIYVEGSLMVGAIADYIKMKNPTGYTTLRATLDKPESMFAEADAMAVVQVLESTFGIKVVAE